MTENWTTKPGATIVHGVPEGYDAVELARAVSTLTKSNKAGLICHVARDDARASRLIEALGFFAPELPLYALPAWDCLPYDRTSPGADIVARRLDCLTELAARPADALPTILITTVNAVLQRVSPRAGLAGAIRHVAVGDKIATAALLLFFADNGYGRVDTVREPGEYAVRGGIIDAFPPGVAEPLRLDFFGDALESIRSFDALTQRTTGTTDRVSFKPVSELLLNQASIDRFRAGYRGLFGAESKDDTLFEAVSAGRKHIGMEHWLPLFYDRLETVFDYIGAAPMSLDAQAAMAIDARFEQIEEYYQTRKDLERSSTRDNAPYHPLPPDRLYFSRDEWAKNLAGRAVAAFDAGLNPGGAGRIDRGGKPGRDFADARGQSGVNVFQVSVDHAKHLIAQHKRVFFAAHSNGARDRLGGLLAEHGLDNISTAETYADALDRDFNHPSLVTLQLDKGFETRDFAIIAESDILGDRLIRSIKQRRNANFIYDASTLEASALVVHVDHGIGRYEGLETLSIGGAAHDCLKVTYAGNDRLFVPVENIDTLSRFGSDEGVVALDKLGGVAWQNRKARVKERIRDIAAKLIQTAAERAIREGEAIHPADGAYAEFAARFPYVETEDQLRAIDDTIGDLGSGQPMDRLICGDVGFGKTEIALRAAFIVAMAGHQVAVVVPTTLLARQHARNFTQRFQGLPLKIAQLSRLVPPKQAVDIKQNLAAGQINIVIGTHALLAKSIAFHDLGLMILDEEQHFGVAQKERLKELKANVHVLTLTATPIPRTLQLALSGVRDMSIIATPPIDRLAVRTFALPYDPVVIREAILREQFRGGQVFYVCPRVEDIDGVAERLKKLVPEAKLAIAHGRLAPTQLEDVMTAFTDGKYDILLSTNIVESGLDITTANTMIIHRADMFGLAQLYQLRGRIGRGKIRAYAYLTLPVNKVLSPAAQKRLEVMQTLDQLGAGFQLASHDLDIRGAGNLLGEEQSGQIREVGIELYQSLLEEAVTAAREGGNGRGPGGVEHWTPQITLGTPVLIPENYVSDLPVRLSLYRRASNLITREDIDAFAAELIDRFGSLPIEVENLLEIIRLKQLCREAGVEKLDVGPKGAIITFRHNNFKNPAGLIEFIRAYQKLVKLRPDHKLVVHGEWSSEKERLAAVQGTIERLAQLAA